jgi:glucose dehydrogenase
MHTFSTLIQAAGVALMFISLWMLGPWVVILGGSFFLTAVGIMLERADK